MSFLENLKKNVIEKIAWSKFGSTVKPGIPFHASQIPAAPNYKNPDYWLVLPDKETKVNMTPKGIVNSEEAKTADVFFIHPTTFFGTFNWNAPLDFAPANEMLEELVVPNQISIFNDSCRIYAPRYRQATFYSFLEVKKKNCRQALELAYEDVAAAFDYYIEHYNQGRPFFIASHSQGTVHGTRLIEEKLDGKELKNELVAAYLVGFRYPIDKFDEDLKTIHASKSALDTNCIVAWDTYLHGGTTSSSLDVAELWYKGPKGESEWIRRITKRPLGVNPLSWTRDGILRPASDNLGAVHVELETERLNWLEMLKGNKIGLNTIGLSKPYAGEVEAKLGRDGFLYINKPKHRHFNLMPMPGGNYHVYDYPLFYMNIRKNIRARLDKWHSSKKEQAGNF